MRHLAPAKRRQKPFAGFAGYGSSPFQPKRKAAGLREAWARETIGEGAPSPSSSARRIREIDISDENIAEGLPDEYRLPLTNISNSPAPGDFDAARWQETLDGMAAFCAEWGRRAAALGWQVPELFSLDDRAPAARVDQRGLAVSLAGGARVVGIDADGADVEMPSGSHLRFYRSPGQ